MNDEYSGHCDNFETAIQELIGRVPGTAWKSPWLPANQATAEEKKDENLGMVHQESKMTDNVNHPPHYTHVPGIECIEVTEHFDFLRGSALKYLWRAGCKGDAVEDLRKAIWYIEREIANLEAE